MLGGKLPRDEAADRLTCPVESILGGVWKEL